MKNLAIYNVLFGVKLFKQYDAISINGLPEIKRVGDYSFSFVHGSFSANRFPSKSCLSDIIPATLLNEVLDGHPEIVGEDFDFIEFGAAFSRFPFREQCRI